VKINLFGDDPPKNRRMTPKEFEQELIISKIFGRPPCHFILDRPTYPYCPEVPKYTVNFDLNAPK